MTGKILFLSILSKKFRKQVHKGSKVVPMSPVNFLPVLKLVQDYCIAFELVYNPERRDFNTSKRRKGHTSKASQFQDRR